MGASDFSGHRVLGMAIAVAVTVTTLLKNAGLLLLAQANCSKMQVCRLFPLKNEQNFKFKVF